MAATVSSHRVEILGVRHFSPACAHRVARRIAAVRPDYVLIEGPSDFNPRLGELLLAHELPIAIYSYAADATGMNHCYAPFVEYSPEWVALRSAAEIGASALFMDLPFHAPAWHDRTLRYDVAAHRNRARYARTQKHLAARFGVDGDDALWDHLFEQTPAPADLDARLDAYFRALRGDDPGEPEDAAREAYMARWVAWAAARGSTLVVCGGWHQPALERLWPLQCVEDAAPDAQPPADVERAGAYLVPYTDRQLDALSGYGAGVPSPQYYRWLWRDGSRGAAERAVRAIVARLRAKKQLVSTASLVAAHARTEGLARLRGHVEPTRCDVLDGLLDGFVDGALDAPVPWSRRDVLRTDVAPQLREMLLALTGEQTGRLAPGTPRPPLVADVEHQLARHALRPGLDAAAVQLDRRDPADAARAHVLWRLKLLDISAFVLDGIDAGGGARTLAADQHPVERWTLRRSDATNAELIRAGAYGPDLHTAARRRLEERLGAVDTPAALADGVVDAIRAGYTELGAALLARLALAFDASSDHGALANAGLRLGALAEQGFWGESFAASLRPLLDAALERVLWLVEGLSGAEAPACAADVDAVRFFDRRLADPATPEPLAAATLALLPRRGRDASAPPVLRGACVGLLWKRAATDRVDGDAVAAIARAIAKPVPLADFLGGVFALARDVAREDDGFVRALDRMLTGFSDHEFLVALPALRQAFAWFPPRERGAIAQSVAALHGASVHAAANLTTLPAAPAELVRLREVEDAIDGVVARYGLGGQT